MINALKFHKQSYKLMFRNNIDGMNDTRHKAQYSQHNVNEKMLGQTNLNEDA